MTQVIKNMEIKFRIVKKENDGAWLSPKKGVEPIKIGWNELKNNYTIKDNVWAIPTEECLKKVNEINEHVVNAATSFILSGGLKEDGPKNLAHVLMTGQEINKICELAGCSILEATNMVKKLVDTIRHDHVPKHTKKRLTPDEYRQKNMKDARQRPNASTSAILADNPVLLELKNKMA